MGLLIINNSKTSVQSFYFCNFIIHRFSRSSFSLGVIWYVDLYTWYIYIPHVRITVPTQSNLSNFVCIHLVLCDKQERQQKGERHWLEDVYDKIAEIKWLNTCFAIIDN
jgi:hypothetical protein